MHGLGPGRFPVGKEKLRVCVREQVWERKKKKRSDLPAFSREPFLLAGSNQSLADAGSRDCFPPALKPN